jgi:hypothetical protein
MWWQDFLRGFWNGLTAWFILIAHAFGKLQRFPLFDTKRRSNWYAFGFLLGVGAMAAPKQGKAGLRKGGT